MYGFSTLLRHHFFPSWRLKFSYIFFSWNGTILLGVKKIFKIMSTLIYRGASRNLLNEGLNQKFTFYCWKTSKKLEHWTENCTNLEYLRRFWTWAGNLPFKNCWKINSTNFWFTSFAIHADAFQPSINHNYNTPLTKNFTVYLLVSIRIKQK